jgi:hypothetical protein
MTTLEVYKVHFLWCDLVVVWFNECIPRCILSAYRLSSIDNLGSCDWIINQSCRHSPYPDPHILPGSAFPNL